MEKRTLILKINLFLCLFAFVQTLTAQKSIVVVTNPERSQYVVSTIEFLIEQEYEVVEVSQLNITDLGVAENGELFDAMKAADLVIISRSTNSGTFPTTSIESWNSLTTPVLLNSPHICRTNRLSLFNTSELVNVEGGETSLRFEDADDFAATDVGLDGDNATVYYTARINHTGFLAELMEDGSNFKLIATADAGGDEDFKYIGLARLEAGTESFDGSGFMPSSNWSYMPKGASEEEGNVDNFQLTDDGKTIFLNEIKYLLGDTVTEAPVAINEISNHYSKYSFNTYPNPCSGTLNISFITHRNERVKVQLLNLNGQVVATINDKVFNRGKQLIKFDTNSLTSDVYFVRIQTENSTEIKKLFVR